MYFSHWDAIGKHCRLDNDEFNDADKRFWVEIQMILNNNGVLSTVYKKIIVSSVYIHPHSNFLLLNDLISVLDEKYGQHTVQYPISDVNAMNYVWNIPEGCILIYAATTYGQAFDIMYRDYTEVRMLKAYADVIDDEL